MQTDNVDGILRLPRLAIAGMAVGIITFAAVTVVLVAGGTLGTRPDLARPLLLALLGLGVAEVPGYAAVRQGILRRLRDAAVGGQMAPLPADVLARYYVTLTLVGGALAEGLSLFGIVIVLVTGAWWGLAAPAVGLALIALQVPSNARFGQFASQATGTSWP